MKLYKEDIVLISDYCERNEFGNLDLMIFFTGSKIEEILLREILLKFGLFRIVQINFCNDLICYKTDLPYDIFLQTWDAYEALHK